MINRLFIKKLTLIGLKKNYSVTFKKGLNYISGPTSTGKSTILEMINYALGSEKHKDYIEVRANCTDVELEIEIGQNAFKISRPLFDFKRPVKIYKGNEGNYGKDFELLDIDSPSNEGSLSSFLLNHMGLFNIKVVNQQFSFRDIFKFSYLKQTEIDTENIMMEKYWGPSIKRKPTFEIIFNFFDSFVSELKAQLKEKSEYIQELVRKRSSVFEFLKSLDLLNLESYTEQKKLLEKVIEEQKNNLYDLKLNIKQKNGSGNETESIILNERLEIERSFVEIAEQREYITKLSMLRNQYRSEIDKIEFLLEGAISLNKYKFEVCPSCLNELIIKEGCELCGSELRSLSGEEVKVYKSELRRLNMKLNKLSMFIEEQNDKVLLMSRELDAHRRNLESQEKILNHLRKNYVSPFVEEIESINLDLGEKINQLKELDRNLEIIHQFQRLTQKVTEESSLLESLRNRIKEIESNQNDKDTTILELSVLFESILKEFNFPKLSNAYIDMKDYLPYVRGRKYNEIGSLGAVTLINMAYYVSILLLGIRDGNNHLGILLIDTPRKNLGANSNVGDEEFKDEKIYNSVISYLLDMHDNDQDVLQLIVVNNGYPEFLSKEHVIIEFDGNGKKGLPYGLIDDALDII